MAHYVVLAFPLPGSINPSLQFANRLIRAGAHVTFLTTVYAHRCMIKSPAPHGLSYVTFSDGHDDGLKLTGDWTNVRIQMKQGGEKTLSDLLRTLADERHSVTCVVYTFGFTWAADVARSMHTPAVLFWLQPVTVFAVYYHYFHDYGDFIVKTIDKDPSSSIKLPGLSLLSPKELPSFVLPSANSSILSWFREQFEALDKEERPRVLVNTFDEAELDVIQTLDKVDLVSVGPLIPLALLDAEVQSDAADRMEMYKHSRNYVEWLDSKSTSSVVYVSFGSFLVLPNNQMIDILNVFLESGRPFLWVIRPTDNSLETSDKIEFWKSAKAAEERKEGMVVPWCSQVDVLSHPSVGCFISHCGWNSTMESLAAGVPLVCLPHWTDQPTNAKMVEDTWKAGVRVKVNEEGVFKGEELKRCMDLVMGEETGSEIRKNAVRWGDLARVAIREGGSTHRNIREFVTEMSPEGGPSI